MSKDILWDVIIVGAGAAGLMTAIVCSEQGLKVLLLDGQDKIGLKILISGGTRCNVTNLEVTEKDFQSENLIYVRHILKAFSAKKARDFFESIGVQLISEDNGKLFPSTNSAQTVLDNLLKKIKNNKVLLKNNTKVTNITWSDSIFHVFGEDFEYISKTVVICTGGLSYPKTGSDGVGYRLARQFDHSLVFTSPSLAPLITTDDEWKSLSGITLSCCLSFYENNKKQVSYAGSFLFTHFGYSGPCVLDISRHWLRSMSDQKEIRANFLPQENPDSLRQLLIDTAQVRSRLSIKSFLTQRMPERFVDVFLKKIEVSGFIVLCELKRTDREKIIRYIMDCPLAVIGSLGYKKAEVTAGGVCLKELNAATLESKLQPGLFFAGEILDVDGRIGGFNFQWAWSSGYVAAKGVVQKLLTC